MCYLFEFTLACCACAIKLGTSIQVKIQNTHEPLQEKLA